MDSLLHSAGFQNFAKSVGCAILPDGRIVDTYKREWRHLRAEGVGADGLSGQVDTAGPTGPSGGSPYSSSEDDQQKPPVNSRYNKLGQRVESNNHAIDGACPFCGSKKFDGLLPTDFESQHCSECGRVVVTEDDVLAFSGSGPLTFTDGNAPLPWNGGGRMSRKLARARRRVSEAEGYMLGHPTDATFTGRISILVLDSTNLKVNAPFRILEQVEAYKFFEQFQFLLPRTPMLNTTVMDSIARWWREYAEEGDLLEIDCTTGYTTVTNERTNNVYSLGSLGSIPTYSGLAD